MKNGEQRKMVDLKTEGKKETLFSLNYVTSVFVVEWSSVWARCAVSQRDRSNAARE